MATQTYWLADPDGVYAPAGSAARRDEMAAAGWTPVTEIRPDDRVWTYNKQVRGWAAFSRDALEVWQARGWKPAVPPMRDGDVGPIVVPPDPGAEPAMNPAPPAQETTTAAEPSPKEKKEDRRA